MSPQAEDPLSSCDVACGPAVAIEADFTDVVVAIDKAEFCAAVIEADPVDVIVAANEAEVSAAIALKLPDWAVEPPYVGNGEAPVSVPTVAQFCSVTVVPSTTQLDCPFLTVSLPVRGPQSQATVDQAEKHWGGSV